MDEALRTLLIAVLGAAAMAITSWGMTRRARGQIADQFALADADRQKQANERDRQLNASLETFRSEFAEARKQLDEARKSISELEKANSYQRGIIDTLTSQQAQNKTDIAKLSGENRKQADDLTALRETLEALRGSLRKAELERDGALALVTEKDGLLYIANGEIRQLRADLDSTRRELEDMQKRLATLESKPDTGKLLNTDALPPGIEPTADALARHESEKDGD